VRRILVLVLFAAWAHAQDKPLEISDAEMLNQRGEKVHFYSDLVKGRVVVIQSIFTTCTTLCPLLGSSFAKVQDSLAGSDVRLISISVDPTTDTPERLKEWGARYHAGSNWTMVTGS
jgi:cytochrome oxidase Cu insertion factor (SCO1/SenC/PrrC family)